MHPKAGIWGVKVGPRIVRWPICIDPCTAVYGCQLPVVKKRGSEIKGRTPQTKFLQTNAGSLRSTELLTESRSFQTCFDPDLNESYLGSQNIYQRVEKLLWLIQRGGAHTAASTPLVAGLLPDGSVPF